MIETINGKAYLKVGDKVYELGGGSNIITADSVEQLPDPATVPEGTIALVASEGESGGGLQVIKLTTQPTEYGAVLTDEESAVIESAFAKGLPFICEFVITNDSMTASAAGLFTYANASAGEQNFRMFSCADFASKMNYALMSSEGSLWIFIAQSMG